MSGRRKQWKHAGFNNGKLSYAEYEELLGELDELKELSERLPIIVEGKNDEAALRSLGIGSEFYLASNGVPFHELIENISANCKEAILLTDMDREGQLLAKKLRHHLSQRGVRINEKFRSSLLRRLSTHQVENLATRMWRVEEQFFRF